MRAKEFITEAETYQPPELSVGDKILKGKFKNSPAEIKGFAKDKHNQPVLKTNKGDVQLFKPRVAKLMKEDEANQSEPTHGAIFLGSDAVIVGQTHGKKLKLSPETTEKVKAIAAQHGAWYEGNGMDRKLTKGIIDDYKGSWDDDLLSPSIKGYPSEFLYVLFSNVEANDTIEGKIGFDPESTIFDRILDTQPSTNYFTDRKFDAATLKEFLQSASEGPHDFVKMSELPATKKNVTKFFTQGEKLMFPDNWEEYPYRAGRVAKSVNDLRDKFLATRKKGVYVTGGDHLLAVREFSGNPIVESQK